MLRRAFLFKAVGLAALTCCSLTGLPSAFAGDDAAHALAEKFAGAGETKPAAGTQSAAELQAGKAAAEKVAADKATDDARRLAKDARRAAQEARAAAERLRLEEQEMLEAARAEAAARETAGGAKPAATQSRIKITATEAPPETPARELPPPMALGAVPVEDDAPMTGGLLTLGSQQTRARVAVLLVMEPGDRGIRRFSKTADPVLCVGTRCFISKGATAPADELTKAQAMGPSNTFGRRAGDCRKSLTCVFRGIELQGGAASIQPVDLKVMIHDRRPALLAEPDTSCHVSSGALTCAKTFAAKGWRAWIVPEAVAEKAGAALLSSALRAGLPGTHAAALETSASR